ncbi:MAG TPA: prolyl oligopeptidase family serine peptidase [Terriglobia bacterium]|nr:prolyl oligopeptidase family serine peptidase [Terriglobia bacterium]
MRRQFRTQSFAATCLLASIVMPLLSQDTVDGFGGRVHKKGRQSMPYRLFVPKTYDKGISYPLVIWLHGGGSSGNDNIGQISLDNKLGTHFWTRKENQERHPAFVLAPQSPGGWDSNTSTGLSDELKLVLEILDVVRKEYTIDPKRIYVAGQSNGGIGVWGLITKKPGVFAAAIPLCGAGHTGIAARAAKTAVWAFHGEKDDVISADFTRKMVDAVRRAGGNPRYTEYKGVGHEIWEPVFKEPELEEWLFAQRLK